MHKKILSINANGGMNFLLKTVFSKKYQLIALSDVYEGMREVKKSAPIHLIIIDIDFHEDENFDFIQHIKSSTLYNIPVIVLTSELNDRIIRKLIEANIYEYFIKPFSPSDLLKTVDDLTLTPTS